MTHEQKSMCYAYDYVFFYILLVFEYKRLEYSKRLKYFISFCGFFVVNKSL